MSLLCQNGSFYDKKPDAGRKILRVDHRDQRGSVQLLCGKAHNVAGGGHTAGDGKTNHLTTLLDIGAQQRYGIRQGRCRGFRRGFVCVCPAEYAVRRDVLSVAVLCVAQQDMQRQNVDIVFLRKLLRKVTGAVRDDFDRLVYLHSITPLSIAFPLLYANCMG